MTNDGSRYNRYFELCPQEAVVVSGSSSYHEFAHFARQREVGVLTFGFAYLFSRTFRFEEALSAIKRHMKYVQDHGLRSVCPSPRTSLTGICLGV